MGETGDGTFPFKIMYLVRVYEQQELHTVSVILDFSEYKEYKEYNGEISHIG